MKSKQHHLSIPLYLIVLIVLLCIELLIAITLQFMSVSDIVTKLNSENTVNTSTSTEPYLHKEEGVLIENEVVPVEDVLFEYVEVIDSCGPHFEGECVVVRTGPGTDYPVASHLRNHVVLKIDGKVEREGRVWYKIVFDEWLRYPERVGGDWYVAADFVEVLKDEGDQTIWENGKASTTKRIVVDRSEQMLYAYEGEESFMEISISTGLEITPTPRGMFTVFKKTPSRYMQGPLPGLVDQSTYDLPGVPWNLYFTEGGAVIHGAYWHESFGSPYSHGCVNVPPEDARQLYEWAELGMSVQVKD